MEGNSHKERAREKENEIVVKKRISASDEVDIVEQNIVKKTARKFLADDIHSVTNYIIYDVLVPAAKDTIVDMVQNGIELLVRGNVYSGRGRRRYRDDRENYSRISRYDDRDIRRRDREDDYEYRRRNDKIDERDFIFRNREVAKDVLSDMRDILAAYPNSGVSIANVYDILDKSCPNNVLAANWGWFDLTDARVTRTYDGRWLLDLPRAEYLK